VGEGPLQRQLHLGWVVLSSAIHGSDVVILLACLLACLAQGHTCVVCCPRVHVLLTGQLRPGVAHGGGCRVKGRGREGGGASCTLVCLVLLAYATPLPRNMCRPALAPPEFALKYLQFSAPLTPDLAWPGLQDMVAQSMAAAKLPWLTSFGILHLIFFYSHYIFASQVCADAFVQVVCIVSCSCLMLSAGCAKVA
jgi:hypothetical protein